jgi:hypothetical protein
MIGLVAAHAAQIAARALLWLARVLERFADRRLAAGCNDGG